MRLHGDTMQDQLDFGEAVLYMNTTWHADSLERHLIESCVVATTRVCLIWDLMFRRPGTQLSGHRSLCCFTNGNLARSNHL